jgi:hypothetical protein
MSYQVMLSVMSPEIGVRKNPGVPPGGRFGPPPGMAAPDQAKPAGAKRLDTLDGKTVYLVDTGFGGGYNFFVQLQKWFQEHLPSVKTVRKRKPGNLFMDDNDTLWEEIKQKGDAAVVGVAG